MQKNYNRFKKLKLEKREKKKGSRKKEGKKCKLHTTAKAQYRGRGL